ncbi:uncharacterized protein BDR25DRAFT_309203 [Lindgomyces ingoldianus]|uniref:Uncharacterized protein n=1 Tax=Lindgomyces ingoldianus TaxID=673940 RepID=A0ACB6RC31_9PLEO|nr:uncharacterized protein BDR25DRAFT_309203 [Lindgomyces ingoldianus]KAF2476848.1 hypothetical protein BDR25DRAFT_309203 [Lindgomyces ingoldianus]
MASEYHGHIDGHVFIPAPRSGDMMNFNFGGFTPVNGENAGSSRLFHSDETPTSWIGEKCAGPAGRATLIGLGGVGCMQAQRHGSKKHTEVFRTMVLDNADDVEAFYPKRNYVRGDSQGILASLAAFIPQANNGSTLITSRSRDTATRLTGSSKNIKAVLAMDEGQALQLLRNKLEDSSDEAGTADLLNALDYMH